MSVGDRLRLTISATVFRVALHNNDCQTGVLNKGREAAAQLIDVGQGLIPQFHPPAMMPNLPPVAP
jgi:hypothetical protein